MGTGLLVEGSFSGPLDGAWVVWIMNDMAISAFLAPAALIHAEASVPNTDCEQHRVRPGERSRTGHAVPGRDQHP